MNENLRGLTRNLIDAHLYGNESRIDTSSSRITQAVYRRLTKNITRESIIRNILEKYYVGNLNLIAKNLASNTNLKNFTPPSIVSALSKRYTMTNIRGGKKLLKPTVRRAAEMSTQTNAPNVRRAVEMSTQTNAPNARRAVTVRRAAAAAARRAAAAAARRAAAAAARRAAEAAARRAAEAAARKVAANAKGMQLVVRPSGNIVSKNVHNRNKLIEQVLKMPHPLLHTKKIQRLIQSGNVNRALHILLHPNKASQVSPEIMIQLHNIRNRLLAPITESKETLTIEPPKEANTAAANKAAANKAAAMRLRWQGIGAAAANISKSRIQALQQVAKHAVEQNSSSLEAHPLVPAPKPNRTRIAEIKFLLGKIEGRQRKQRGKLNNKNTKNRKILYDELKKIQLPKKM